MPFEKTFEPNTIQLTEETIYRFAEVELSYALQNLVQIYRFYSSPRHASITALYNSIVPNSIKYGETEADFYSVLDREQFRKPRREEKIHYLLMKGTSYVKIREITSASFNTISKLKFEHPQYYPLFNRWNQEMLQNWNAIKHTLNLFNEELVQMKGDF